MPSHVRIASDCRPRPLPTVIRLAPVPLRTRATTLATALLEPNSVIRFTSLHVVSLAGLLAAALLASNSVIRFTSIHVASLAGLLALARPHPRPLAAVTRLALVRAALPTAALTLTPVAAETGTPTRTPAVHALAVTGDLKYGPGFTHFEYTDPQAVRGGEVRLARVGTFDSLNPFILKGVAAAGTWSLIYSRLCEKAQDEPLSEYGHLAESMWLAPDRSSVTFFLRPEARWHDGEPVTAHDIVFSFYTLVRHGTPFYRTFYADVDTAVAEDDRTVTFELAATDNRELPVVLGQLRALPKHYWEARDFTKTTLEPPLGSGPYRIESVDPGRSITYARVDGNWDEGLPARRGQHNFDRITYDYYRDDTVAQEALKAGEYDLRAVSSAREWATGYDHPAVREGRLVKAELPNRRIRGMSGFVFNTRRARFADPRVRHALAHAFDFEWTNATLFHGLYTRTESHFANSELAATGTPEGRELEILESYRGRVPDDVFGEAYRAPSTDGDGSIRANLRKARRMLRDAGWVLRDGELVHEETGEPMAFEFLLVRPSYERVVGPVRLHLERLGIATTSRTVDASQYYRRLQEYDYDVIVRAWNQYLSPGNEQRNYWSSAAADTPGTRNYAGVRDPVVDELVEGLIAAQTRPDQVAAARALDRVLTWGHYVIPHWHTTVHRLVYWNRFARPAVVPMISLGFPETWWIDPALARALEETR